MKLSAISICLFLLSAVPAPAIVTLGQSNQNYALTGIGPNASGLGQSKVTFGTCVFDGVNTTCTLSGPFTGLGTGTGTYAFAVTYLGNGPFPLIAVQQSAGSNLVSYQSINNFTFVITLAENGGPTVSFYSFANFSIFFSSPACTGVTGLCDVAPVGVTPNATITGPVTGSFDPAPAITPNGALSADSYGSFSSIAPATWMVIYGVNLANTKSQTWATADFNGVFAPTALGGTTVTVAGKPAYIDYVSPGQVNVQVPSGIPSGPQSIVITTAGGSSAAYTINVNPVQPGLLAPLQFTINGNQHVVALFSNTFTYVLPVAVPGVATLRAKPGDNITLYGIGFGPVTPDIPAGQIVQQSNKLLSEFRVTFGGVQAVVNYQGLGPADMGLYQFNVVVPNVPASDAVPVAFTLGGVSGQQNLVIAIAN